MALRRTFEQFRRALEARRLSAADLADYLEIDPQASPMRVRFRPGALADAPPPDYDVDEALYRYQRSGQRAAQRSVQRRGLPRVVAEGDSWFNLPPVIRPRAIANWIAWNGNFNVSNLAYWGDTLEDMLQAKEYLSEIERFKPVWFLLSAGGNDVEIALAKDQLLQRFDPSRPLERSLSERGERLLQAIGVQYADLLREVTQRYPGLPIICHAYDYPRPDVDGGHYIGQYLAKQGYPPETQRPLAEIILDRLSDVVEGAARAFAGCTFLDGRRVTDPYTWWDDMHPAADGFKVLADRFEARMTPRRRRARRRKKKRAASGRRRRPSKGRRSRSR